MTTIHDSKTAWWDKFREEFLSTYHLYCDIFRHPTLLIRGTYTVARDIFYELPRSLLYKKNHKHLQTCLDECASQALTISEIMTIPGTYLGFTLWQTFTTNPYLASIVWANVGDYVAGVSSYAVVYMILTRGHGNLYTPLQALRDNLEVIKDCLPAALILYISDSPIVAAFLFIWFPPPIAVWCNLIITIVIFMWVAKYSATRNIEKRFI